MEVNREVLVDAPPDEVWEALTEPEALEEWFANEVELDVRPGGEGTFRWDDGSERHARVERVEAERLLEFWWWSEDEPATRVEIALEAVEGATLVRVTESEWAWAVEMRFAGVGVHA